MTALLIVVGAVLLGALVGVSLSLRIVKQYEEGVLFHSGRVVGVRTRSLNRIVPVIDVLRQVPMRIATMANQSQGIITGDSAGPSRRPDRPEAPTGKCVCWPALRVVASWKTATP